MRSDIGIFIRRLGIVVAALALLILGTTGPALAETAEPQAASETAEPAAEAAPAEDTAPASPEAPAPDQQPAAPSQAPSKAENTAAPTITTQPSDASVEAGQDATFTAAASGAPKPSVRWQTSTDNGASWKDIDGADDAWLAVRQVKLEQNGTQYRAVFTNAVDTATTNAAHLTVTKPENVTREVANAQFRWGLNNESNNKGFAPGTYNFFSAGKLSDPQQGYQILTSATTWQNGKRANWSAGSGNVRIEKAQPGGGWKKTNWRGTQTTPDGSPLGPPSDDSFSNHQVVIEGGTGQVNAAENTAKIQWKGDFTVVYYSGMTFFYISDPVLEVKKDGSATVKATLSGFGADMDDTSKWEKLSPQKDVLIANFGAGAIDVDDAKFQGKGFEAEPRYRGVTYNAPANGVPQVRTGDNWGTFPQQYVDFQQKTGQHSYWYTSGGSTDRHKVALPVTVSYDAKDALVPDAPASSSGGEDSANNAFNAAPPMGTLPTTGNNQRGGGNGSGDSSDADAKPASAPEATYQSSPYRLTSSLLDSSMAWAWWLGGGLLTLAALLTGLTPVATKRLRQRRSTG